MSNEKISRADLAHQILLKASPVEQSDGLTSKEILNRAIANNLLGNLNVALPSSQPANVIQTAIESEISSRAEPRFNISSYDRPRKYKLSATSPSSSPPGTTVVASAPAPPTAKTSTPWEEIHLHAYVATYAMQAFGATTATIRQTGNTGKDLKEQWRYPDLISVSLTTDQWEPSVATLFQKTSSNPFSFYSFEVKQEITNSNVRDCFFQALSNSAWANRGFLVAGTIEDDLGLEDELRRLNQSYGIGIIQLLDPQKFEENILVFNPQVIFPARERNALDWEPLEYLSSVNTDLKSTLTLVNTTLNGDKTSRSMGINYWDAEFSNKEDGLTINLADPNASTQLDEIKKDIESKRQLRRNLLDK